MPKNDNSLDWKDKLSQATGVERPNDNQFNSNEIEDQEEVTIKGQTLVLKLEKKGRAGKTVTIVEDFEGSDNQLKKLAKELKNFCGTGGSIKEEKIIIQGNVRDKITDFLQKKGFKTKRVGA